MSKVKLAIITVAACIVAAVLFYLYLALKSGPAFPGPKTSKSTPAQAGTAPQTLGGPSYEQVANPIRNKVPSLNPVANPVQGLYKNPFQ
jgi:hypothetical protein